MRGSLAQLGEHLPYKQEVIGSSPITPTILLIEYAGVAAVSAVERKACQDERNNLYAGVAQW